MDSTGLVIVGLMHTASISLKWWTTAIASISACRRQKSERYDAFRASLCEIFTLNENTPIGIDLNNLSDAQKWLLLVVIDEFLDQDIVMHDSFEAWFTIWKSCIQMYLAGYAAIENNTESLDRDQLGQAWQNFRAALS